MCVYIYSIYILQSNSSDLKIISLNVKGINHVIKSQKIQEPYIIWRVSLNHLAEVLRLKSWKQLVLL